MIKGIATPRRQLLLSFGLFGSRLFRWGDDDPRCMRLDVEHMDAVENVVEHCLLRLHNFSLRAELGFGLRLDVLLVFKDAQAADRQIVGGLHGEYALVEGHRLNVLG